MRLFIFLAFIIILYTQGLGMRYGIPEDFFKIVFFVFPLTFIVIKTKWIRMAPGLLFIGLFVIWSIVASIYNSEGIPQGFMFSRYLLIGYLVFFGLYNSYFSFNAIRLINRVILVLFFLQVAAAIFETLFLERMEYNVGTMASDGGGLATTFPMYAFCFFFSGFLFFKKIKYLVLGASLFIVGYASGKLGIYFLLPLLAFIGYLFYLRLERLPLLNKQSLKLVIGFLTLAILFAIILPSADSRTAKLNLENLSPLERVQVFVSFAEEDNEMAVDGYTISRQATSLRIIEETFKREFDVFLFGQGFKAYQSIGHILGESAYEEYRIVYGITGWSYDALVMGWPGVFFHVLFFFTIFMKSLGVYKSYSLNTFGKMLVFACLLNFFTFLINYFFYNYSFTIGGWIICTHLYFSALILAPQYRYLIVQNDEKMPF